MKWSNIGVALLALVLSVGCTESGVAPDPSEASAIVVSPASFNLAVGAAAPLDAVVLNHQGDTLSAVVTWSSEDPSVAGVDGGGRVTAVSEGDTRITASALGAEGHAAIVVTSGGAAGALFQESFDDPALAERGWYDNTALTIVSGQPRRGAGSLQVHFESGSMVPTFGGAARRIFEPTETVRISFWVRYSENWVGSLRTYHPHDFQILTTEDSEFTAPADTHLTAYIETNHQGGIRPVLGVRDRLNIDASSIGVDLTGITEDRAVAGCNGPGDSYPTGCFSSAVIGGTKSSGSVRRLP